MLGPVRRAGVLVGNECYGMAGAAPVAMRRHLFQDFSLPGQPRDRSRPLGEILADEGIRAGQPGRCRRLEGARRSRGAIDAPAFIVDELRRATERRGGRERHRPC